MTIRQGPSDLKDVHQDTSVNMKCLRDRGKATCLLRDLLSFGVNVAAIQETHFVCDVDACVLASDFLVYAAYGDRHASGVSLIVSRPLNA